MQAATKPAANSFQGGTGTAAANLSMNGPTKVIIGATLVTVPNTGPECSSTPSAKAIATMKARPRSITMPGSRSPLRRNQNSPNETAQQAAATQSNGRNC